MTGINPGRTHALVTGESGRSWRIRLDRMCSRRAGYQLVRDTDQGEAAFWGC